MQGKGVCNANTPLLCITACVDVSYSRYCLVKQGPVHYTEKLLQILLYFLATLFHNNPSCVSCFRMLDPSDPNANQKWFLGTVLQ